MMRIGCVTRHAGVILFVLVSSISWTQVRSPNSTQAVSLAAEQNYKNIQVLKGVPSDQLIPAMQFISAALGVECGFCHVENHFDQDDKKAKQTARKMMKMMMAINQSNFDGHQVVTCNTCHHGSRTPLAIPAIAEGPPKLHQPAGSEEQLPANMPSPDQIVAKYREFLGGSTALQGLKSLVEKGTADFAGRQVPVEIMVLSPNKRILTLHLPGGDSVTAVNETEGWVEAPRRPVHTMSRGEQAGARLEADLQLALHLKEVFAELRPLPPERLGDRECYVLLGEIADQPRARFYFDQQSGQLIRMDLYAETPLGLNPTRIDYSDYRAVEGVQVPYRWTVARPGGQFSVQVTEATPNAPIPEGAFMKPPNP